MERGSTVVWSIETLWGDYPCRVVFCQGQVVDSRKCFLVNHRTWVLSGLDMIPTQSSSFTHTWENQSPDRRRNSTKVTLQACIRTGIKTRPYKLLSPVDNYCKPKRLQSLSRGETSQLVAKESLLTSQCPCPCVPGALSSHSHSRGFFCSRSWLVES